MWCTVGLNTQCPQRPQAADAQHNLLPNALVDIATVQLVGDLAVLRQRVLRNVRIQQKQLHPADVDVPDLDEDFAAGKHHADHDVFARLLRRTGAPAACRSR